MKNQPKQYDDDDGRVICSMNVDGTRLHEKSISRNENSTRNAPQGEQMTRSEARRYTFYAVLASLLVVLVFAVTWVLFILFCTQIWFR